MVSFHPFVAGEVLHLPHRALADRLRNVRQALLHLNNITRRNISTHNRSTYHAHITIPEVIVLLPGLHEYNTPLLGLPIRVWCVKSKTFRSVSSPTITLGLQDQPLLWETRYMWNKVYREIIYRWPTGREHV